MSLEKFYIADVMPVYIEIIPQLRNIDVQLVVKAGSIDEPNELAGVSHALEHCVHLQTPLTYHTI